MKFGEKLDKLAGERSRAELSRQAGLPQNAISDYVNKGYIPRLDTAAALAKVLGASLDWLADDSQGWPPPKLGAATPAQLSHDELMTEVARRYRQNVLHIRSVVEGLKDVRWDALAESCFSVPPGDALPPETMKTLNLLLFFTPAVKHAPVAYDARLYANAHHASMPGSDEPIEKLDAAAIEKDWNEWAQGNPLVDLVEAYLTWVGRAKREKLDTLEPSRLAFLKQIRSGMYSAESQAKAKATMKAALARAKQQK